MESALDYQQAFDNIWDICDRSHRRAVNSLDKYLDIKQVALECRLPSDKSIFFHALLCFIIIQETPQWRIVNTMKANKSAYNSQFNAVRARKDNSLFHTFE